MKVDFLNLEIQHQQLDQEIMGAIRRVLDDNIFILGPEVSKFEKNIANYCGAKYAIGVSSGTDALLVSLMALDVGTGDEVITTPFSFFATAGVIARVNAKPVFVDIDPATLNISVSKIGTAITSRTKAIIPVHLFGQCCDMNTITEISQTHGLSVIEDAAQAIGAEYIDGRRAGTMGDLGCFSFFPSKNLGALGDAGMVITDSDELAEKVRRLRVHGSKPKYFHSLIGGNFRLDALQAAVLNVKLGHLNKWTEKRQQHARQYETLFSQAGLEGTVLSLPSSVYENTGQSHYHIYNQYVVRVPNRDELRKYLQENGIGSEVYYPVPFHLQECFEGLGYQEGDFPEAERAAQECLALPIFPELTKSQQEAIVDAITTFYNR